jgi:hypothetical protein
MLWAWLVVHLTDLDNSHNGSITIIIIVVAK